MSEFPVSPLLRSLLHKRGISEELVASFLKPDYVRDTHAPELLTGMDRAVSRLLQAIAHDERIAIYADFDCDGIPGASILSDFFGRLGYKNVLVYIPHRDREGYGFHRDAIDALKGQGVSLIITVDVGTTAVESVDHAARQGIDVIVTDHHEIPGALPHAVAVLNPKIAPYPFPSLCGAAVAFKLVQATLAEGRRRGLPEFLSIPSGWEKWLLDLVAIATVADMVPLVGENRALAYWGLEVLRKSKRPGISALCARLRLNKSELTEDDIGFSIAPRINAASRMDEPGLAHTLLTTDDPRQADAIAAKLEALNASRKGIVAGMVREARKRAQDRFSATDTVVVLGNPEWKPALLGLAANSLVGDRGGVVCLWGRDSKGNIKGSCRSDGSISVVDLFSSLPHVFSEAGGHAASGGFTLVPEYVHTLHDLMTAAASRLDSKHVERSRAYDERILLHEVASSLFNDISLLAPFGVGNPKPIFHVSNVTVRDARAFGKEKNHFEITIACAKTGAVARAFDFFRSAEDFTHAPCKDAAAHVLATVERDTYRGGLALRLVDVLPQ